jgi:hypothetical protein
MLINEILTLKNVMICEDQVIKMVRKSHMHLKSLLELH